MMTDDVATVAWCQVNTINQDNGARPPLHIVHTRLQFLQLYSHLFYFLFG